MPRPGSTGGSWATANVKHVTPHRTGLAAGIAAYVLWGLLPLYWPLLEPAAPVEILAHRIAWSLVFAVILLALTVGFGWLRGLGRRRMLMLSAAAVLVTCNWGLYIYGVNNDQVVETSLGYFINPLVTVALAVVIQGERLTRGQSVAVGVGALAVAVLAVDYGRLPWIALALACSFGTYGLIKKRAGVDGTQSFAFETGVIFVPAVGYLLFLGATRRRDVRHRERRPHRAARAQRPADRDPADAVRRRRLPDPAHDGGPAPVPRAHAAVPDRRADLPGADAGLAAGRASRSCGSR